MPCVALPSNTPKNAVFCAELNSPLVRFVFLPSDDSCGFDRFAGRVGSPQSGDTEVSKVGVRNPPADVSSQQGVEELADAVW